jgi:hypothetical protein
MPNNRANIRYQVQFMLMASLRNLGQACIRNSVNNSVEFIRNEVPIA